MSAGASTVAATVTQDLILAERIGYGFSNGIYAKNRAEEEALSEGWIIILFLNWKYEIIKITYIGGFIPIVNIPFFLKKNRDVGSFMDCPSISEGASTVAKAPALVVEDITREVSEG